MMMMMMMIEYWLSWMKLS